MKNEQKAVIYARYSSQRQNEESIEQQVQVCKSYAKEHGYIVTHIYADEAISGRSDRRPEFQKMIRAAENKNFDIIIAYKSNRIARNMFQALLYADRLEKCNVTIEYAKEFFGNDAAGRFAMRSMMNLNQFYSENMSEDIKRAMRKNAQEAKVNSGVLPLGYQKGSDGRYAIKEDEAQIIRYIFKEYDSGTKAAVIAEELNAKGLRTRRGIKFKISGIEKILRNNTYIGVYKWDDIIIKNGVPPIINKDVFERVQQRMNKSRRAPAASWSHNEYLLTGKLFCGHCGLGMVGKAGTGKSGRQYQYYMCVGKKDKSCDKKNVRKDMIEDFIYQYTKEYIMTDETIALVANQAIKIQEESFDDSEFKLLQDQLRTTETKLSNLIAALASGINSPTLMEEIRKLEEQKVKLQEAISECDSNPILFKKEDIVDFLKMLKDENKDTNFFKKQIFDIFINAVYLYDDGSIKICYNYDKNNTTTISLEDIQSINNCSPLLNSGSPQRYNANTYIIKNVFIVTTELKKEA